MSVEGLRKALEQKAKTIAELNKQCRHTWRVCKDCMAHCEFKDAEQFKGKWVSLEDVEAFLVELFLEKVIVPRKQLEYIYTSVLTKPHSARLVLKELLEVQK